MIYSPEEEQRLMTKLWSPEIANNPFNFVMFSYPWGKEGTPLAMFKGPRTWQVKFLKQLSKEVVENNKLELHEVLRKARASGRGIGKSTLVAWLIHWFMTTRIGGSVIVSANSEAQLRTVTWAELTKWVAMGINAHWFQILGIRMVPAKWLAELVERDLKKGTRFWAAEGKLWSEENPDAYAGPHNYDGMMIIFDEASGIPDAIWPVAAGFLTENTPNRFWFAFSNPRRNAGYFYECFHNKLEFWDSDQIDARTVEGTDQTVYDTIIKEFGEHSDEAKVEVYGEFPSRGDDQFFPEQLVKTAIEKENNDDFNYIISMGIDPGKGNPDPCGVVIRRGRDIIDIIELREEDPEVLEDRLVAIAEDNDVKVVGIDEIGLGWAIGREFKRKGIKVYKFNSSREAANKKVYFNKRAEMWDVSKKFMRVCSLPKGHNLTRKLKGELLAPKRKVSTNGKVQIESKKEMKSRGVASPNLADAYVIVANIPSNVDPSYRTPTVKVEKDPFMMHTRVAKTWLGV